MNQKLFELFNFCGKNNIDFTYETSENGKNQITHSINETQRNILVKISDPEDENLDKLIDDKIKEFLSIIP